MEALGASLAIASLTIQLVQGYDSFKTFFEECRDPTINIHELLDQLNALRKLFDLLEKQLDLPGYSIETAVDTSLKDELGRSRSRLQDLTNLVLKFEAGSSSPTSDDCRRGAKRMKNYLNLHSQQKKIRKYAEKLDRTRAIIHDHFNSAVLSNMYAIRSDQQAAISSVRAITTTDGWHEDAGGREVFYSEIRRESVRRNSMDPPGEPSPESQSNHATGHPDATSSTHERIDINQKSGTAYLNMQSRQTIRGNGRGGKVVMFDQSRKAPARRTDPEQALIEYRDEVKDVHHETPNGTAKKWDHKGSVITITSKEETFVNKDQVQDVLGSGEDVTMFDQSTS